MLIHRRFCGPPDSANGGYFSGLAAAAVSGNAVVTLRLPPPLETDLRVTVTDGSARVEYDGATVATIAPGMVTDDAPSPVGFEKAQAVAGRPPYPDPRDHPFPTCFVCGPAADDGLRLFPGSVPGRDVVATPWIPAAMLAADRGDAVSAAPVGDG